MCFVIKYSLREQRTIYTSIMFWHNTNACVSDTVIQSEWKNCSPETSRWKNSRGCSPRTSRHWKTGAAVIIFAYSINISRMNLCNVLNKSLWKQMTLIKSANNMTALILDYTNGSHKAVAVKPSRVFVHVVTEIQLFIWKEEIGVTFFLQMLMVVKCVLLNFVIFFPIILVVGCDCDVWFSAATCVGWGQDCVTDVQ